MAYAPLPSLPCVTGSGREGILSADRKDAVRRLRIRFAAAVMLAVLPWAVGCGDGGTEPLSPDPARATTLTVTPAATERTAPGATVQLMAEVRDENGNVMSGATVSWSSSAPTVAAVDGSGLVTTAGNGTATITATAGSATGTAAVTVAQAPNSVVVLPAEATTAILGEPLRLVAEAFDENGHAVEGAEFTWSSSDDQVAGVDGSGLVTTVGNGTATITASAGSVSGSTRITVVENPDRAALIGLYEATDGPNWVNSENWLTDAPLGEWYGVDTDGSGRVIALNLAGTTDQWPDVTPHGLEGPIPPEIGRLGHLQWLDLDDNALTGPVPPEIGNLGNLEGLDLDNNALSGRIPPELGNLVHLVDLDLTENDLTGPAPLELDGLTDLEKLSLRRNALTGPLPQSLLDLTKLRRFSFQQYVDLCAPGIALIADWLQAMEEAAGPFRNESDRSLLESLFDSMDGPGWTNAEGWLGGPVLADWRGIRTELLGRVTALDLSRNGLAGRLPGIVGDLAQMTELRITDNADLSGRLPLSLARLSLQVLHYSGTELCAPVEPSFHDWLSAIPSHESTGAECAQHYPIDARRHWCEWTPGPVGCVTLREIDPETVPGLPMHMVSGIRAGIAEWAQVLAPTPAPGPVCGPVWRKAAPVGFLVPRVA